MYLNVSAVCRGTRQSIKPTRLRDGKSIYYNKHESQQSVIDELLFFFLSSSSLSVTEL